MGNQANQRTIFGNRSGLKAVAAGLFAAQVLAVIQIYFSNRRLYEVAGALRKAGFLVVPNNTILPTLKEMMPVIYGGLFFTFSIGLGIILCSSAAIWLWRQTLRERWFLLPLLLLPWSGILIGLNISGLNIMDSLYFLIIPAVVGTILYLSMPVLSRREAWLRLAAFALPLLLFALLLPKIDDHTFVSIRDAWLLNNPIGSRINDFYYRYTLYPAEAFKSLDQKQLRTYRLAETAGIISSERLAKTLLEHDYLPISGDIVPDLEIIVSDDALTFRAGGREVLQTSGEDFFRQPAKVLLEFSDRTDRHLFFRQLSFLAIVFSVLIIPYLGLFALFRVLSGLLVKNPFPRWLVNLACGVLAVMVLSFAAPTRWSVKDTVSLPDDLHSTDRQQRVAALRYVAEQGLEIGNRGIYENLLIGSSVAERYWLARALGESRLPSTFKDLVKLLDDPQPNVVCMAFYGLGRRGDPMVVPTIVERLAGSGHWYEQWYGYRALKNLGWRQADVKL
jgi:hypothetical protein